ncbi:alcohol dehydrogenase [Enterococcus casseliflavus]|jgi:L-iditol 2-dehydrogenase|uniref:zinc-binding dehydrogenase n=1 Tax=Enterococcus innesii TaxID=2839759 RepID=UPI0009C19E64|nr:alcohol dehydrogenase catalytic domain-containing protein [Enterococcus innesii]MEB5919068.1 alcohol dehydrogenase catalytic domain-containing protein [Enterococcus innesii]OQO84094.1 alcohol dehydrogenase [Enterococcus casseliflavus]
MKKVMFYAPKDIRVEEATIPEPGFGEVVVKNHVTLTCGTDVKTYMRGYRYEPPFSMGHETAGTVFKIGEGVKNFKVGDRVVPHNSAPCNHCYYCKNGLHSLCDELIQNQFTNGGYAEYQLIPKAIVEQNMFLIPENMSDKQAALLEPLACAVYGIDNVPIKLGDTVCVNGCGPIGLMFIRLAYLRGARVIACDLSLSRLRLAEKLGAAEIIQIAKDTNQVEAVRKLTENSRGVDSVIEAVGLPEVWELSIDMVRKGGFVLCFGGTKKDVKVPIDTTRLHYDQITLKGVFHTTPEHVNQAFELLKMNAIKAEDFVQKEYDIENVEQAILEHAAGDVIKNCISYTN